MLTIPSAHRNVPVRLTDLPKDVRMSAARHVCKHEPDPVVRLEVVLAAVAPSSRVYWVAA